LTEIKDTLLDKEIDLGTAFNIVKLIDYDIAKELNQDDPETLIEIAEDIRFILLDMGYVKV